jgi:hypothetical protein
VAIGLNGVNAKGGIFKMRTIKIGIYVIAIVNALVVIFLNSTPRFELFQRYNTIEAIIFVCVGLVGLIEIFFLNNKSLRKWINVALIGLYALHGMSQFFYLISDTAYPRINMATVFDFDILIIFVIIVMGRYGE